ncbi:hypothetical protein B0H10DRAFT_2197202 [Mycena sp. CBHHK59/15]|nr:hypothetical protein B0H10DRAFT_2197202 [Mycena sp. CBHHK59/15]
MTILGKGRVGKSRLGRTVGRRAVVEEGQHRRGRDVVGVGRRVTWAVAPAWWKVVGGGAAGQLGECVGKSSRRSPGRISGMHRTWIDTHHAYHWGFECMFDIYMTAFNGAPDGAAFKARFGFVSETFWFFLSLAPNSKCSICGSTSETRCWIMNSTRSSWEVLMGPTAGTHAQGRLSVSVVQFVTPLSDDDSDYPRQTIDLSAPVAS